MTTRDEARIQMIEKIAERFLGTVMVDNDTETLNLDIPKEHEDECAAAINDAIQHFNMYAEFLDSK